MLGSTTSAGLTLNGPETPRRQSPLLTLSPAQMAQVSAYGQLSEPQKIAVDAGAVAWSGDAGGWVWAAEADSFEVEPFDLTILRWDGAKKPAKGPHQPPETWPAAPLSADLGASDENKPAKLPAQGAADCAYAADQMPEYLKSIAAGATGGKAAPLNFVVPAVYYLAQGPTALRDGSELPADAVPAFKKLKNEMRAWLIQRYKDRGCWIDAKADKEFTEAGLSFESALVDRGYDAEVAEAAGFFIGAYQTAIKYPMPPQAQGTYTLSGPACREMLGAANQPCSAPNVELPKAPALAVAFKQIVTQAVESAHKALGLNMDADEQALHKQAPNKNAVAAGAALGGAALLLWALSRKGK